MLPSLGLRAPRRRTPSRHVLHARAACLPALLGLALALGTACAPHRPGMPGLPAASVPETIRVRVDGRVMRVPIEEYVLGSALAEVSPTGESEATATRVFEVQAVLARTYASAHLGRHAREGFDLCDGTHCQLYDPARIRASRFARIARDAVARTAGRVIMYGRRPIDAVYHADCGGHTADAADVWGGAAVPYLSGVEDDAGTHRPWSVRVDAERLRTALDSDARTAVGGHLAAISVDRRDTSGRAAEVAVFGDADRTVPGAVFRAIVNTAVPGAGLRSTRFSVTGDAASGWTFTGTGYGHGVGLCQVGAAAMARRGMSLGDILGTFYPGTTLGGRLDQAGPKPFPGGRGGH